MSCYRPTPGGSIVIHRFLWFHVVTKSLGVTHCLRGRLTLLYVLSLSHPDPITPSVGKIVREPPTVMTSRSGGRNDELHTRSRTSSRRLCQPDRLSVGSPNIFCVLFTGPAWGSLSPRPSRGPFPPEDLKVNRSCEIYLDYPQNKPGLKFKCDRWTLTLI